MLVFDYIITDNNDYIITENRDYILSNSAELVYEDNFGDKIYSRFPPKYREDDEYQNFALKRYIQALHEGGFKLTIEEWQGILELQNADVVSEDILPILFAQYGFEWFNGIPEEYLRYFFPRLSEAWSKKGTIEVIDYVISVLSGIRTEIEVHTTGGVPTVIVTLIMDDSIKDNFPDPVQFNKILDQFLPFYVNYYLVYDYVLDETAKINIIENMENEITENKGDDTDVNTIEYSKDTYKDHSNEEKELDDKHSYDIYQGLFTNVEESVLNDSAILIPDIIDYVTIDGETKVVFESLKKIVGL